MLKGRLGVRVRRKTTLSKSVGGLPLAPSYGAAPMLPTHSTFVPGLDVRAPIKSLNASMFTGRFAQAGGQSQIQASPVRGDACAWLKKAGDRCQAIQREVPGGTGPPPERAQGQPYRRTRRGLGHELCSSHSWICRERRQGGRRFPAIRTPDETAGARSGAGPTGSTRDHSW